MWCVSFVCACLLWHREPAGQESTSGSKHSVTSSSGFKELHRNTAPSRQPTCTGLGAGWLGLVGQAVTKVKRGEKTTPAAGQNCFVFLKVSTQFRTERMQKHKQWKCMWLEGCSTRNRQHFLWRIKRSKSHRFPASNYQWRKWNATQQKVETFKIFTACAQWTN